MIEVTEAAIDPAALQRSLANPAAGGYCAFEGWVRNENEGHVVERLEIILIAAEFDAGRAYGELSDETSDFWKIELEYVF